MSDDRNDHIFHWEAGVCYVFLPHEPETVGKGRDEICAVGDLYIQLLNITFVEKDEYKPLGENIPGLQKILEAERVAESPVPLSAVA